MPDSKSAPKPLTAQPVGSYYAVETHGLHHVRRAPVEECRDEEVSDNFLQYAAGCYRRRSGIDEES